MQATITATAIIAGKSVSRSMPLGTFKIAKQNQLGVELVHAEGILPHFDQDDLPVIEIRPGTTTRARVRITRTGYNGRVNFWKRGSSP